MHMYNLCACVCVSHYTRIRIEECVRDHLHVHKLYMNMHSFHWSNTEVTNATL